MIKKSEIRIGNKFLNANLDNIVTVEEIKWTTVRVSYIRLDTKQPHVSLVEYDWINPIPLTSELLLSFGFQADYSSVTETIFVIPDVGTIEENSDGFFMYRSMGLYLHIKYLHQLQNLYYCLT